MTAVQLAAAAGGLTGLGLTLIIWRLAPAHPELGSALDRLAPQRAATTPAPTAGSAALTDRLGLWLQQHAGWIKTPGKDLAVLRIPPHRFLGQKASFALVGLAFPPAATLALTLVGAAPSRYLPALASLLLAGILFLLPNRNVAVEAAAARLEFARALGAYIDLVALERRGGAGATQALETAAEVGESWVFRRLREELSRARWSGIAPWDGLTQLSDELGLPDLSDLADIMRLSGEQGATVYATLRARSAGLRNALLNAEHAKANEAGSRMSIPIAVLPMVFALLLMAPAILRALGL